tara:strand:- start:92 stop:292 length:201 start_codon:yes stop_codon:yes gene_type:complete
LEKENKIECWTCKYQQRGGINLLGCCLYFEVIDEEKKDIPPTVVDIGCKFYEKSEKKIKKVSRKSK